jgi:SAM-dependent methyltransferase
LARYLSTYVPPRARVVELGAGYCHFINRVPAARRVAVDLSAELPRWAAPGVEVCVEDAVAHVERVGRGSYDFVFASNLLEHLEWSQLDRLAAGVRRALRPGGLFGLVQPNFRLAPGRYFDDYTHRTIFTDVSLSDWLSASGFEIVAAVPRFLPLTVKSRLGALTFLVPVYLRSPWRPFAGQMFVLARQPGDPASAAPPGGGV